jgi:hypothetical protein
MPTYNIPVSVADNQDLCTFFFPAIVNKDNLVIGLTSSGQDHGSCQKNGAEDPRYARGNQQVEVHLMGIRKLKVGSRDSKLAVIQAG